MEALIIPTTEQVSISDNFGYTASEVAVIQNTVAKGTSKVELAYFINVCKSVGLNPFVKEIWCYKDNRDNLLVFAGRDGFLAKAQTNPFFNGIRSSEVCQNDVFSMDIANNKIEHSFGISERGAIVGAYAIVFRKNGEPTIEYADFKFYNKGYNTWKTHPSEMIKKVAETHALKKAFGISGIQSEYDFNEKNGVVVPVGSETKSLQDDKFTQIQFLLNELVEFLTEEDVIEIESVIKNKDNVKRIAVLHKLTQLKNKNLP